MISLLEGLRSSTLVFWKLLLQISLVVVQSRGRLVVNLYTEVFKEEVQARQERVSAETSLGVDLIVFIRVFYEIVLRVNRGTSFAGNGGSHALSGG